MDSCGFFPLLLHEPKEPCRKISLGTQSSKNPMIFLGSKWALTEVIRSSESSTSFRWNRPEVVYWNGAIMRCLCICSCHDYLWSMRWYFGMQPELRSCSSTPVDTVGPLDSLTSKSHPNMWFSNTNMYKGPINQAYLHNKIVFGSGQTTNGILLANP
jgi:hypothetical protein